MNDFFQHSYLDFVKQRQYWLQITNTHQKDKSEDKQPLKQTHTYLTNNNKNNSIINMFCKH